MDYLKMSAEELRDREAKGDLSAAAALRQPECGQGVRRAWGLEACPYRAGHTGKCRGE